MNKNELVSRVSAESEIPIKKSQLVVSSIFDNIEETLANGDKVRVLGFGSFEAKERAARVGRNPRTGEILEISSTTVPVFRPGKKLKASIMKYQRRKSGLPKIVAVTSGKGGVGKTNYVINTAIAFAQQGLKTYIIDADLGTANVDVLLGIKAKYTIEHLVNKTNTNIMDVVVDGPGGIKIIAGGSGIQSLTELSESELNRVFDLFEPLENDADVIIIDTGSGISRNVINFLLPADEIVVVVTPEPSSITDAYALIKVLNEKKVKKPVKMVFNMVDDLEEARNVAKRMLEVIGRFLEIKPYPLGYILRDNNVNKAVKIMEPFILAFPGSPASKNLYAISEKLNPKVHNLKDGSTKSFIDEEDKPLGFVAKLKQFFRK
ncbi:MAG: hypothetical protein APF76_01190 [Desulfitibacter sp. BRH_c19]|nr:MAG: hypothetical protein APF76_01190 [Desulfitibacter sp. BRH_c19]